MIFDMIRQHMNATIPFLRHTFIEIGKIGPGAATTHLPDREELKNHIGTAHAAALFALGETASGAALGSALGELLLQARPVAATASIQYVKKAKGPIRADARVERDTAQLQAELQEIGKVRFDVLVSMYDESEEEVATMTVDWHVKLKR